MFTYKYQVPKNEFKTTYGSVCIENIVFEPSEIERVLPEIVFEDENLKHMFAETDLKPLKRKNIYKRFLPKSEITVDINQFVEENIRINKSFYSFLAEGILGLIFRDIHNFDLARGIIDIGETLSDSHTGVDACMYNLDHNVIVLGEAKFYETLTGGMKRIISDFIEKSIKNKLESLQTKVENSDEAYQIVIKNLAIEEYEELTVNQFMNQRIIFAGFVLHSETDVSQYGSPGFYDKYFVSSQQLTDNIQKSLNHDDIEGNYEIILVHLPIKDKKSLIVKMIEMSKDKLRNM